MIMSTIGGGNIPAFDSGLDPQLAHHFKYPFVIHFDVLPMQLCGNRNRGAHRQSAGSSPLAMSLVVF
jgi:hypothetical protein